MVGNASLKVLENNNNYERENQPQAALDKKIRKFTDNNSKESFSYWKQNYYPHTEFITFPHEEVINTEPNWGSSFKVTLSKYGDLLHKMWLQIRIPPVVDNSNTFEWVSWLGHVLIKEVTLEIGPEIISRNYGQFMQIDHELQSKTGHQYGYSDMIGNTIVPSEGGTIIVPIDLFFTKLSHLSLPICALYWNDITISIQFESLENLYRGGDSNLSIGDIEDVTLMSERVHISQAEKRKFIEKDKILHYPVETIQRTKEFFQQRQQLIELPFINNVSELLWVVLPQKNINDATVPNQWFNFTDKTVSDTKNIPEIGSVGGEALSGNNPVETAEFLLDGSSLFSKKSGIYFNRLQPYHNHNNIPPSKGINMYSFSVYPEWSFQPSGTINMNGFTSKRLRLSLTAESINATGGSTNGADVYVYARTMRQLMISNGSARLDMYNY